MISWLQTVTQRHHKILFSVLLVVIIIAFVFTVGNFGGPGPMPGAEEQKQDFYGFNLNDRRTIDDLNRWTVISAQLNAIPLQNLDQQQYTMLILQRALGLHLAQELQLPKPNDRELSNYMQRVPAFTDPQTGLFSRNRSQQVIDDFNSNPSLGEALLTTVLLQDYRIERVLELLGGPGYVLTGLAEASLQGRQTEWVLEVATLSREAFKPQLDLADEALASYFEANKERYKPEDKTLGAYVLFPTERYLAKVGTPTQAQLESFYASHSSQWDSNDNGQPKPLSEVDEAVRAAWKLQQANELASTAANKLTLEFYNAATAGKVQDNKASIAAFLKAHELELVDLPAFTQQSAAAGDPQTGLPQIKQRILALYSQSRFYSDAIQTPAGAAIGFSLGHEVSPIPTLADIRAEVQADYTREQTAAQFSAQTQSVRAQIETALAEGKSFADAAKALDLSVSKTDPFTLETPPADINPYYLFASMDLPENGLSQPLTDAEGSSFVYVTQKKLPEISTDSEEVRQAVAQLEPMIRSATISSSVGNLIDQAEQQHEHGHEH